MTPKQVHPATARFSRLNAQKRRSARFFCGLTPAKAHLDKDFHAFRPGLGRTRMVASTGVYARVEVLK